MTGAPSAIDARDRGVTDGTAPAPRAGRPAPGHQQKLRPWRWVPLRWLISGLLLLILSSLSIGLAQAERRLDAGSRPTVQGAARPRLRPRAPDVIQWGGVAGSLLTAAAVHQALRHREREAKQNRQYLRALRMLNRIAAAITAQPDAPRVLWQLAEAARRLLGMDRAGVLLLDGTAQTLELLAFSGDVPPEPPRIYRLQDLPACRAALSGGRVLFAGDVERNVRVSSGPTSAGTAPAKPTRAAREVVGTVKASPAESQDLASPANRKVAKYFRARSLILIPLQRAGRRIGLVTLAGSRPRRFNEVERRLAELLATQASVILASSRLYVRLSNAIADSERLLRQRDALAAVNEAVISAPDLGEALRRVARLTPAALEVDACGVLLVRRDNTSTAPTGASAALAEAAAGGPVLELAAATPPLDALIGGRIDGPDAIIEQVFRTGEPAVVPDLSAAADLHPSWDRVPGLRSVLAVPLFDVSGKPLAVVSLACRKPGEFGPGQVEAAKLFASRIAAAIENARLLEQTRVLLEQTRRDADTRQMLLRELNHRVKNNLFGIVTLLSLEAPEMSGAARRWLDRAIGRIRSMSEAHELFSGGATTVDLADLVSRTLAGLSVAMPPGVSVNLELGDRPVPLPAEKVIGLAMVLHELCFNAAVHGLRPGGTLTIRARAEGEQRLTIDVMDDGPAGAAEWNQSSGENGSAPAGGESDAGHADDIDDAGDRRIPDVGRVSPAGTGIGLTLVRGLVSRELGGQFSLNARDGGGTVATVAFPLPGGTSGPPH